MHLFLIMLGIKPLCPSLWGFGLLEASCVYPTAFISSCLSSQSLCTQLLSSFCGSVPSFPSIPGRESTFVYPSSLTGGPLPVVENPSKAQYIFQYSVQGISHSVQGILFSILFSAWLRAIPSESLGLTLSVHEFVVALRFWLGVPMFSGPMRRSFVIVIDDFEDHVLACGSVPMRVRQHDALCEVIWYTLLQDHAGCKWEQWCGSDLERPGDKFYPDFQYGKPFHFDLSVRHSLQDLLLYLSAAIVCSC